jgi:hypothetical protein
MAYCRHAWLNEAGCRRAPSGLPWLGSAWQVSAGLWLWYRCHGWRWMGMTRAIGSCLTASYELSTPPHGDAVTFGYRALAYSDTDFHRADLAPSRAHGSRLSATPGILPGRRRLKAASLPVMPVGMAESRAKDSRLAGRSCAATPIAEVQSLVERPGKCPAFRFWGPVACRIWDHAGYILP